VGKLTATCFITLDNVVQDPHLWSGAYQSEDTGHLNEAVLREADAMVLGRETYEGFAAAWPSRSGDPFSDKFNSMPKYVVSSTLEQPEWTNSTVLGADDLEAAVAKLKQESDGDVVVHGSAQLAQALIQRDLVDELRLMVFPVVLGTGKRLFGDPGEKKKLRLVDSKVVGDGVVILTYAAAPPA
jgi:dihydrofolate reductase